MDDGETKGEFNITRWLKDDVKLPQYNELFLEQGFQSPEECCQIDENVLNLLGIEKLGHRKRILISSQKLGRKYGLLTDQSDVYMRSENDGENMVSIPTSSEQFNESGVPPVLPPKRNIKKPEPPPRHPSLDFGLLNEQEVISSVDKIADSTSEKANSPLNLAGEDMPGTIGDVSGLPPGFSKPDYEHLWEAEEGKPLAASPIDTNNTELPAYPFDIGGQQSRLSTITEDNINNKQSNEVSQNAPPIPPRSDLEHLPEVIPTTMPEKEPLTLNKPDNEDMIATSNNNTVEYISNEVPAKDPDYIESLADIKSNILPDLKPDVSIEGKPKKQAPQKPPRKTNFISKQPQERYEQSTENNSQNVKDMETGKTADTYVSKNGIFNSSSSEKQESSTMSDVHPEDPKVDNVDNNIYGNIEKQVVQKTISVPTALPKRPKPVPRARTLSSKSKDEKKPVPTSDIPPALPERIISPNPPERNTGDKNETFFPRNVIDPETVPGSGSCTEDDLSGSDTEMPTVRTVPDYETVTPPRASVLQPRHTHKEGYLFKQGGQQNNKGWKKRWVVFDGKELRYYKDKEHMNESLQVVPCTIMKEVRIVTEDAKRARFDLTCAGRTYMFALALDEMDAITVWAQILMGAIILYRSDDVLSIPGGVMSDPVKQGFLKKQGNNVVVDYKKRYIVIKKDKFAYYHNREDFVHGSPINTLEMSLANVKIDPKSHLRFQIVTPHRTYVFQCNDENELRSWVSAIETAIQFALSDTKVVNKIWENPSNRLCADCGKKDPVWASVNLVVCVCEKCIGAHRKLGVQISKPRSLLMDQKIWQPSLIKLLVEVGNETSNKFWMHMCPDDDFIYPDSSSEERSDFIYKKYEEKRYRHVSALFGAPLDLGEALRKAVVSGDIETTMQLVFCGADVKYVPADGSDTRTPFELAKDANQELQIEFLQQNGGKTENERPGSPVKPSTSPNLLKDDFLYEVVDHSSGRRSPEQIPYEKEGFLQKKAPTAAVWKRRHFTLRGRELWYDKGEKEVPGIIKLKDVIEYIYNNTVTLDIVTSDRTYNLRADTKEEALSWYTALRNKQVFKVALEFQELGTDGIPHVVANCLQFVETYGLDNEGIYRKNGNKAKIKALKKLFDQDVESVLITREEYEPDDVAGLLKEYFRELPDPLMTEDAYPHFITASLNSDHDKKMYMYKEGLERLSDVNRNTLKYVIGHLVRVVAHSAKNLMKLENVSLIFGPTLMSNEQMGAMDRERINQEFSVIGDFIAHDNYTWLFNVDEKEKEKDKNIEIAMKKMMELSQAQSRGASKVTELTLDVHSMSKRQECSRITVFSNSKASMICREIVAKRGMAPDGNWALFQVANGEIERPFPATEKVLETVMEMSKYTQLTKDCYLVVKENYIAQKMQLYGFLDDLSLVAANTLQTMKESKKKEKWGKSHVTLEKGVLSVHKTARMKDELDSWPLDDTALFFGIDREKKPVTGFGFTIARTKNHQCYYRYFCFDDERELYRWISVFLKLKYPATSLWVDMEPIGFYQEIGPPKPSIPVKKKPPSRQIPGGRVMPGVSSNVVNELRARQKSLKK